jgi:methyltransferase family protein
MNLWSDFLMNDGRVIQKWKHYFTIYERHFSSFVYKPVTFVEIGVAFGGSLPMWKRYFGPNATIVGIDILPECKAYEEDQVAVRIGAQQDTAFLKEILEEFGPPDIVLDDGSHTMSQQIATFEFLYPRLAKNGVYMVEDLHTAYWPEFEGGLRREGTFIELCKDLFDQLNAEHSRGAIQPSEFTKTTMGMHLYDSVAVFERGTHTAKLPIQIGRKDERSAPITEVQTEYAPPSQLKTDVTAGLKAQLNEAISARDETQRALRQTRESLAASQDVVNRMRNSVSWRLTEPARRLMYALRSGARKVDSAHTTR